MKEIVFDSFQLHSQFQFYFSIFFQKEFFTIINLKYAETWSSENCLCRNFKYHRTNWHAHFSIKICLHFNINITNGFVVVWQSFVSCFCYNIRCECALLMPFQKFPRMYGVCLHSIWMFSFESHNGIRMRKQYFNRRCTNKKSGILHKKDFNTFWKIEIFVSEK